MKVSFIIPVYNVEKYLSVCIKSILDAPINNYEILLIDDGSKDSSGHICDEYANKYETIKVFHLENGGPSKARNYGISCATGDYIQFVDADDEIDGCYIDEFLHIAQKDRPDVILGEAKKVDNEKTVIRNLIIQKKGCLSISEAVSEMGITEKELYLHYIWNKWYLSDIFKKNNISFREDVRLGEDFLLNCRVFSTSRSLFISDKMMYYYFERNRGSLTGTFRRNELDRRRMMDNAFLELLKNYDLYNSKKAYISQMIGGIAFESVCSIGTKKCPLSFPEKIKFIQEFTESEYSAYLDEYRKSKGAVKWKRILIGLLEAKCYRLFILLLTIKRIIK